MTCPKQMVYGPCAGVTAEGGCEIDAALPCPFVDAPTVRWAGPEATAAGAPAAGWAGPEASAGAPAAGWAGPEASAAGGHPAGWAGPEASAAGGHPAGWAAARPFVLADLPTAPLSRLALL